MSLFGEYFRAKKEPVQEKQITNEEQFYFTLDEGLTEVRDREVMNIPIVYSCVNLIADLLSTIDFKLYDTKTKNIIDDNRVNLLNYNTGTYITPADFRKSLYMDALIYGHSHAYIVKKGLEVKALVYIPHNKITIMNDYNSNPIENYNNNVKFMVGGESYDSFNFVNLCFSYTEDGIKGESISKYLSSTLGVNKAINDYTNKTATTGFLQRGMIKAQNRVDKSTGEKLKSAYNKLYGSSASNLLILSNGLDFKDISSSNGDIQLEELRKATSEEISNALGVPISIINGTANEETFRLFLQTKINPLLNKIESALNQSLLLYDEIGSKQFIGDVEGLQKTSLVNQLEAYNIAISKGIMTRNEVREKLNLIRKDGLDSIDFSLGSIMLTEDGKYINFNLGTVMSEDDLELNDEENIVQE